MADEEIDWDDVLAQLSAQPEDAGWVTIDEATTATGMAKSTLRSWYREGLIPSRMVVGPHGPQRVVPLDTVLDRAMQSPRIARQIDRTRSVESALADLRARVADLEARLASMETRR